MRDKTNFDEPEPEWNPGGLGNATGADEVAPIPSWNPDGTGNASDDDDDARDDDGRAGDSDTDGR